MQTIQLGEVVMIDRAVASESECRSLPYVGLEHIEKDSGRFTDDFRPQPETLLATKFRFTAQHVLYGKLRPYLNKVAVSNFTGVCTTEILPLLPKPGKLQRDYLYALLLSPHFVKWASQNVSGANLPRLDPERLLEFEIPLLPLAEQEQIAGLLGQADRLRRARRYALELSDTFIPAVFLEMFGDPKVCVGWPYVELEEVADIQGGLTLSPRRQQLPLRKPYLRVANVQTSTLDLSEVKYVGLTEAEFRKTKLEKDDLLLVEGNGNPGEVGRGALWTGTILDCVHQNHLIRVRCNRKKVLPEFLIALTNGTDGRRYFLGRGKTTSGLFTISTSVIANWPILLPPLSLQQRFAALVERHERLRAGQREALRQAEHLFQTLLYRAFDRELGESA